MSNQDLTEDQLKFLKECEVEFANRFTEADRDYQQVKSAGVGSPPIVHPWYSKHRDGGGRAHSNGSFHRGRDRERDGDRYRAREDWGEDRQRSHHHHRGGY